MSTYRFRCKRLAVLTACLAQGCATPEEQAGKTATEAVRVTVAFTDVTQEAGIRFEHHNGRSGRKYLPETLGSGAAFFDYDNDGDQDLFLVNSRPWSGSAGDVTSELYNNQGDGRFEDATAFAQLDVPMYGLGAAPADYDNDGFKDLYVTVLDGDRLFRNRGGRHLRGRDRSGGDRQRPFRHQRGLVRLRSGRTPRPDGGQLCPVVDRRGLVVLNGWHQQDLLHAGVVRRPAERVVPELGRRHLRGRERGGGGG